MLTRLGQFIDGIVVTTLVLLMTALVANVLWQVATRFLLDDPSSVTEEIARFLLMWIGLLGGCYAYRQGSHLGLDLLTAKLSPPARSTSRRLVLLVAGAFAAVILVYGGGKLVWLTLELRQTSAALGVPMGYVYCVLPLSGILIAFYSAVQWHHPPEPH